MFSFSITVHKFLKSSCLIFSGVSKNVLVLKVVCKFRRMLKMFPFKIITTFQRRFPFRKNIIFKKGSYFNLSAFSNNVPFSKIVCKFIKVFETVSILFREFNYFTFSNFVLELQKCPRFKKLFMVFENVAVL